MVDGRLDPPLFEVEKLSQPVSLARTPFLYNDGGRPTYLSTLPAGVADLRVPQGWALYIPPKPSVPGEACIDLHNNRNSARACWGDIEHDSIVTHTLLRATGGFFHWFWNAHDTAHGRPAGASRE